MTGILKESELGCNYTNYNHPLPSWVGTPWGQLYSPALGQNLKAGEGCLRHKVNDYFLTGTQDQLLK